MAEFNIPGLKDAIKDVEKLQEATDKAAKSMLQIAISGEKATKALGSDSLKKYNEQQKTAKTESDKLAQANERLIKAQSDEAKELARINVLIQQQNQINKAAAQTHDLTTAAIKKEASSIAEARAQIAILTQARNNVNLTTEEGRAKLVMLNDALDKNNAFIKENADAALKQKMSIGDYATGMQTALENTGLFNGKLGQVAQTAIGFVQQGAKASQKLKDINDSVVSGAGKLGNYVTAKLGFIQAEKASTAAIEMETLVTEENAVATAENKAATIGFTQASKAATVATETGTAVKEGNILATEGMAAAQTGVVATSEAMTVAETEATVATTALDVALGILLSPITLVVAGVAALFYIFKDFAPLINPIKDAFAALMAVFNVIKQDIFDLITGARSLGEIFSGFADDTSKAAKSAMELAQATRDLAKAQDINEVAMAQAQTRMQALILQSKNRTKTEEERVALIKKAQEIEEAAFKKTNDLNNEAIRIAREKLFESKHLNEEERAEIEKDNYAYIRKLKIKKNLDEDELKSYKDLLLKKEELARANNKFKKKPENRRDQLEDKAKEKAEKAAEKAKKDAEEEEKRQEKAVKDELERRKKSAEIAINAMKSTLDFQIASYDQSQNIEEDNLAHVEAISAMKIKIAQAEMQKNLIGVKKGSLDEKAIRQDASNEIAKIETEKNKAIRQIAVEGIKGELELYDLKNKTLIKEGASITDILVKQEKERLEKEFEFHKEGLERIYDLDAERIKEKVRTNKALTDAERNFFKELMALEDKKNSEIKKNDKALLDSKVKAIETEEKTEDRKFKLLNKGSLANQKEELKNERKALTEKLKLFENDAEKRQEIELALAENKKKTDDLVKASKEKGMQDSLSMFIDFVGKESELGKAAAIAQTTINTYEGVSRALKDYPAPYSYIVAGLTLANGLKNVAQIEGVSMFADGTTNAPFGKHIVDEEGPELIFSKSGQLITTGSSQGAHFHEFKGGETVIPADVSAIIRQTMFKSYGMTDKQMMQFDYSEIGKQFGKHTSSLGKQLTKAIEDNATKNIVIPRSLIDRGNHRGKRV